MTWRALSFLSHVSVYEGSIGGLLESDLGKSGENNQRPSILTTVKLGGTELEREMLSPLQVEQDSEAQAALPARGIRFAWIVILD